MSGFQIANLYSFRRFYFIYPSKEKLYALRRELGWTTTTHLWVLPTEQELARELDARHVLELPRGDDDA